MPGLDTTLVTHKLNVNVNSHLVKQAPRVLRHKLEFQIKDEVEKVLQDGLRTTGLEVEEVNLAPPEETPRTTFVS